MELDQHQYLYKYHVKREAAISVKVILNCVKYVSGYYIQCPTTYYYESYTLWRLKVDVGENRAEREK